MINPSFNALFIFSLQNIAVRHKRRIVRFEIFPFKALKNPKNRFKKFWPRARVGSSFIGAGSVKVGVGSSFFGADSSKSSKIPLSIGRLRVGSSDGGVGTALVEQLDGGRDADTVLDHGDAHLPEDRLVDVEEY